ncbi:MAG: DUF1156 domain-containing protein, partial [Desulfobacterales bacterium]|nr:DUF1156 domain-containing protein [Desulfobacterales bacterium]
VAWFIVKTEVEPVDIEELKAAFKRLEERLTLSGKPVKEELLSHYKTECPCCGAGREEADIIYTFWVKSAICTNPTCRKGVPLFPNYIVAKKSPSVQYVPDYQCSKCKKTFDLDLYRASLVAEESLIINNARDAAGDKRTNKRWAAYDPISHSVICPWCQKNNDFHGSNPNNLKKVRKKVPLTVLLCPYCYTVWQYRGTLPEEVPCPVCSRDYNPNKGNTEKGSFVCPSCGTKDKIINSIRKLPEDQLFPTKPYAIEGYCAECAGETRQLNMYGKALNRKEAVSHPCNIHNNRGKFFKRTNPADFKRYQNTETRWKTEKENLPYPKGEIPVGEKTKSGLIAHHYRYWHQMFNPRQLLCLSTLLNGIGEEDDQVLKEMLLTAFFSALETSNLFTRYHSTRFLSAGVFARHDYQPKLTICENNVWGTKFGNQTFINTFMKVVKGKTFSMKPNDSGQMSDRHEEFRDPLTSTEFCLYAKSSASKIMDSKVDFVITDPPYAGNVNYAELADFFYVWLRLVLAKSYPAFSPEATPKAEEIIENPTRGKSAKDFEEGLTQVFSECHRVLEDSGLMIFTFHHKEGSAWESLLRSVFNSGFMIAAVYPIHSEAENTLHLMGKSSISYDLIHVCKKRNGQLEIKQRSWAGVREEIRRKARKEIELIEAGRYGKERLSPADVNIILIGKCLELYSKYYGMIVDYKGDVVTLGEALTSIRMMVEQIVTTQQPLPSELEHVDPVSYIYLTCLCDRKEIKSDEVHKTTRGIMEPEVLIKAGVIRKGRAKRGRTYEVKLPVERYKDLTKLFRTKSKSLDQLLLFPELEEAKFDNVALVDVLHYLMGLAEAGENLVTWLNQFKPIIPNIRVSFEYLLDKNPTFQGPVNKVLSIIEV